MVERPDLVLAVIPVLALAGPMVAAAARRLESATGIGGWVAGLPLTVAGFVAALAVVLVALFALPETA